MKHACCNPASECIGVPVGDHTGKVVAAVSIAGRRTFADLMTKLDLDELMRIRGHEYID
jgi:DNA-binding IclR family transcriptional regulator